MKLVVQSLICILVLHFPFSEGILSIEEVETVIYTFDLLGANHPWAYSVPFDTNNPLWLNYFQDSKNISSTIKSYFDEWDISPTLLYDDENLKGVWTSFTSEYCYKLKHYWQDCSQEKPFVTFTNDPSLHRLVGLKIRFTMHENATLQVYEDSVEVQSIQGNNYDQWTSLNITNISFGTKEISIKMNAGDVISGSYILLDKITVYAEMFSPTTTEMVPTTSPGETTTDEIPMTETTTDESSTAETTEGAILTTESITDATSTVETTTNATSTVETTTDATSTVETTTDATSTVETTEDATTTESPHESTMFASSTLSSLIFFEVDTEEEINYPWINSLPSDDPANLHWYWFNYLKTWDLDDSIHIEEYFAKHNINTTELANNGQGFWSTFSNKLCYPGTFPPETTTELTEESSPHEFNANFYNHASAGSLNNYNRSDLLLVATNSPTPVPDCLPDVEYPFFSFDITYDIANSYILEAIEITYAMHENSRINISVQNSTGAKLDNCIIELPQATDVPYWQTFTYIFSEYLDETAFSSIAKIIIELVISSDELDSGEFLLIDKIAITASIIDSENMTSSTFEPTTENFSTEIGIDTTEVTSETESRFSSTESHNVTSSTLPTDMSTELTRRTTPSMGNTIVFPTILSFFIIFLTCICIA